MSTASLICVSSTTDTNLCREFELDISAEGKKDIGVSSPELSTYGNLHVSAQHKHKHDQMWTCQIATVYVNCRKTWSMRTVFSLCAQIKRDELFLIVHHNWAADKKEMLQQHLHYKVITKWTLESAHSGTVMIYNPTVNPGVGRGDVLAAPHLHPGSLLCWNANDGEIQVPGRCAGGSEEVERPPSSPSLSPSETLSCVITWEWREKCSLCKYRLNPRQALVSACDAACTSKTPRLTFL